MRRNAAAFFFVLWAGAVRAGLWLEAAPEAPGRARLMAEAPSGRFCLPGDGTPLAGAGIGPGLLEVLSADGAPLPHRGPVYKVGPATSLVCVEPGPPRLLAELDLAAAFDLAPGQDHWVRLTGWAGRHAARKAASVRVVGPQLPAASSREREGRGAVTSAVSMHDCSGQQTSQVLQAVTVATAATEAAGPVWFDDEHCALSNDYMEWFGHPDRARRTAVAGVLRRAHALFDAALNGDGSISADCTPNNCGSGSVFAYVYRGDATHTIYLCNQFWAAPSSLTWDSRPGTLVHEMTHFEDIGDTSDHAYGRTLCRSLAANDPDTAADNADSYEYFVESAPSSNPRGVGCDTCEAAPDEDTCNRTTFCGLCGGACRAGDADGPYANLTCETWAPATSAPPPSSVVISGQGRVGSLELAWMASIVAAHVVFGALMPGR